MSTQTDWIVGLVSEEIIAEAQRMRAERDARYGNIFDEYESDSRWVGEVGEICFDRWLGKQEVAHEWILEDAAGRPDFVIGKTTVGIKTAKRKGAAGARVLPYSPRTRDLQHRGATSRPSAGMADCRP